MNEIFQKYDIELETHEYQKLGEFLEIFMSKNSQINLSAIREKDAIIEKHFVDSLMLGAFFDLDRELTEKKVCDLGTGGGFPGIPLAITFPDVDFTLVDSVQKKLTCVEEFADQLELTNIDTHAGRAEEMGQDPDYRESFDLVTSRATAYLPTLLEYALPLLKVGGILASYKLQDKAELTASKKALARLGGKILKVKNYTLAGQERVIIFIEKIALTHKKYPRRIGEPLKNPIM